mmetsp:Transcript_6491/g.11366  ORF Transcript_6491/g.11366 Transcript_6491/m.11366 type:complete len:324 (-) Transcript_6491:2109-3080(-)
MDPHWTESFDDLLRTKDLEAPHESAFSFRPAKKPSDLKSFEESPYRRSTPRPRLKPRLLQSPLATSSDPSNSKSVAFAMRALQDRIRELEDSQSSLVRKLETHESEGSKLESMWRLRLSEEMQLHQERNRLVQEELVVVRRQFEDTKSDLDAKQAEVRANELEIKRLKDALAASQESNRKAEKKMAQSIEIANGQLNARKDEFERLKLGLQQAMYEKQLMVEELQQSQDQTYKLECELEQTKQQLEVRMKDSENLASAHDIDLSRKNAELTQQLKRQELLLGNFTQEKDHQKRLIDQLNAQVNELKQKVRDVAVEKENFKKDL